MTETNTGLREGQEMPYFELPDEEGLPYGLFEHLQRRPLVLVFYRGTGDRTATGSCRASPGATTSSKNGASSSQAQA